MEFDDDTHLCLRCSKTIFGLENYVIHRQEHCLGVQLPCNSKEDHETFHSPPLSSSPPQNSPWDVPLTANDFFSCLELQSTITPTPVKQQASPSIFSNESNPVPSFPEGASGTELEFLSPPESISCSSLISTHTPICSKEMDKSEVDYLPPHSHTGGKWKPGSRLHLINRQQCAIHSAYSFLEQNVLNISDNLSHSVNLETTASAEITDVVDAYFKCPHCGHDFSCETQMNSHISSSHKDIANNRDIHTKSKCPYSSFSTSKKSCFSLKSSEFPLKPSSRSLSPFKCTSCNELFRGTFNFCCHLFSQKHRSKFAEYQNWLSEIFQYENIIIHSMPFQCLLCFFYVSDFILFMKHVKSSEHIKNIAGTNNPIYCFTCSFECRSEEEMVSHLYSTHEKTLLSAHPVMILEKGCTFFCTFCNGTCKCCIATFNNDGLIAKTGKNDTLDEVTCKKKNYRQHEARKRTCVFCKISFSSSEAFKYHRMKCSKALSASNKLNQFSRKKNVNRNAIKSLIRLKKQSKISNRKLLKMCSKNNTESCIPDILCHSLYKDIPDGENVYTPVEQHSQGEIYKCSKCVFHATTEISLLNHEEDMHEGIQPAADNICGSSQLNKQHVSEFKEIHSLAELKCEYNDCQHLCHSVSELTQHMKLHSKLRPYQCGMCDYCGKTVHQLKKHQRTHTGEKPFKCKLCTYSASRSHQLLRHMRLHTGSKPYKCPYCDYTCNNQENIRKHILKTKKHEGKKMYPCTYCDFACNESQSYQKHLLGNHKEYFPMGIKDIDSSVVAGLYVRDFPRKIVASMVVS